jgi:predicted RNA binding protein YcfA (HicA-like mRNA interferase family)
MSKAEKLAAKILSGRSDQNFAFDDLCYVIERAGFQRRTGKGSHRIYYKDGIGEIINVPAAQRESKTISGKTGARTALKV